MKRRQIFILLIFLFAVFAITSCAPSGYEEDKAGFLLGLWHGFILFFSVIGKIFNFDLGIYAVNNNGLAYWLGFFIGLTAFFGGGGSAARKKKC